ncbi:unnamed protein product [Owenia fusiformis]|uniref:Uncharacterized protein n=1 Tax=Owenia fusiformis TaxID=6347 RepID=A0A8J1TU02_OWEFU|nr:unnamed protein product [Owenia fusiformis]
MMAMQTEIYLVTFACVVSFIETHVAEIAIKVSKHQLTNLKYEKFPNAERLDNPWKSFKVVTNARCAATCSASPDICKSYNLRKLSGDRTYRAVCELNGPSATPPTDAYDNGDHYDRDECHVNNGGCSDICTNTFGSFVCSCPPNGYVKADGLTCTFPCPEFFTYNGEMSSCYMFVTIKKAWSEALSHCATINANLVAIESEKEDDFIRAEIRRKGMRWPGFNDDSFYTGGMKVPPDQSETILLRCGNFVDLLLVVLFGDTQR